MAEEQGSRLEAVQELAANGPEPPRRYVLREQQRRPDAGTDMPEPIPVVDLSRLSGSDGAEEAAKLRSALQSWGLFLAVGHEIESTFLDRMMNVSKEFFELPREEKQKYTNLINGKELRLEGYGHDTVASGDQILDWCDRLYLIVEPEDEKNLSLWPTHPPSFRDVLHEYTIKSKKTAIHIVRNIAKLLDLSEGYFDNMFSGKNTMHARFNYYPHCPRPDLVYGLKPHTDGTIITLLVVDKDVGGLQVLKDGIWYNVPMVPNALVVNLGDSMEIISNGVFKSPVHRVVTNAEKERLSVVMFYNLDCEKELEPAEALIDAERPRLYRKIKVKDYLASIFESFSSGTRAIDTVKI